MADQISIIPKGWKITTLGAVAEITSSKRIFANEYKTSGIPFFRGKEVTEKFNGHKISTELFITEEKYNEIKGNFGVPEVNDILLTSVGTLGNPYLVEKNLKFYFKDGNLTWFRNYKDLLPKFLFYWIISPQGKEILSFAKIGSTQEAYTISKLKGLSLNIPELPEQRAIAAVLSSLDDKIEFLREQNITLEATAQAIFKEWFVNFNFPGATGKMIDSELGEIPEGWRVGKLGDEVRITMGQSPAGESYNESKSGTIFFQGRTDFGERFPQIRLYTTEPKRMAKKFDVLVSVRAPVGDINVASDACCIGRGLAAVFSEYKSYALYRIQSLGEAFNKFETEGTVFGSINKDNFSNIEILIPRIESVKDFDKTVSQIDKKIFNNHIQIQTLSTLRDILLPKLMEGQIRVEGFTN